ncbi:MAG: phosphoadenosine phosphosulfate reductase family protein [Syntrophales bacterium]|nr:phosphoadenosine phosphosulfate reductase family protein [Syntrophales bacterium]
MEFNKSKIVELPIEVKIHKAKLVIKNAIEIFGVDNIAIAITGGKDSTTNLWLFKQVCAEHGYKLPMCMFIDEGDVFEEIIEFIEYLQYLWSLEITYLSNDDVMSKVSKIGDMVQVDSLNSLNQAALKDMGFSESEFEFIPDSTICNHLMKTITMNNFILKNNIKTLATAIRWDEMAARNNEVFLSERTDPPHNRLHPILHLTERNIWITIFKYKIPYNDLYLHGYRSLGAKSATKKLADVPAWMQDLENTPERVGRGKEKEQVMDHLRSLGYM